MSTLTQRILKRPERNICSTDFATRVVASGVLFGACISLLPQLHLAFPIKKIVLLATSELGILCVVLGLFLRAKTRFAGLQLLATSLAMLWLESRGLLALALVVGALSLFAGAVNLVTRRSRLNQVLNFTSIREALTVLTPPPAKETP